jgi:hypothetical protein
VLQGRAFAGTVVEKNIFPSRPEGTSPNNFFCGCLSATAFNRWFELRPHDHLLTQTRRTTSWQKKKTKKRATAPQWKSSVLPGTAKKTGGPR